MHERITYNTIKDSVEYGFDEYINNEHFTIDQTSAKILEEDWREVNHNLFTRKSYLINIAIESLKNLQIADFILDNLNKINHVADESEIAEEEFLQYQADIIKLEQLRNMGNYEVISTSLTTKSRIEYLLNLSI